MDPSEDGFSILGPALNSTSDGNARTKGSSQGNATQVPSISIPGTFIDVASDTSTASDAASRTTTPPEQMSRHESDFPPTPPTMTNSDVSKALPAESRLSPSPIFADRVRQELQRHKSGLSTPVNLSNSPPTPDPSPPSRRDTTQSQLHRPSLLANYASSYAESFQTATEGRSTPVIRGGESPADLLLPSDVDQTPRQSWIEIGRAMGLSNKVLAVQEEDRAQHTDSETNSDIISRVKNYHLESDGSDGEKETKSELKSIMPSTISQRWVASSDSPEQNSAHEEEEESLRYSASDELSTSDSTPVSPTLYKSSSQRQPVAIPRLARPFQPGDDIKRPDSYLLYGSAGAVKNWKKPERMSRTPPAREMDSEFLRNAEPVFQSGAPEVAGSGQDILEKRHSGAESGKDILQRLEDVIKENEPEPIPLTALPPIPPEERQILTPAEDEVKPLEAFVPTSAINSKEHTGPAATEQKESSLEDNNVVYKMIQEENAKRHSAISDGSVQARVVIPPEHKPKLRHTPKRDSLRGDTSMRSSSDSIHQLRHKRRIGSLGHSETAPDIARHSLHDVASARQVIAGLEDKTTQLPARNGEKRFSYSAIQDCSPRVAPAAALGNPHKLRRSLRHRSLDYTPRSVSDSARPLSMATTGFAAVAEEAPSSPELRRASADHRLGRTDEVRRIGSEHVSTEAVPASPRLRKFSAEHRLHRNNEVRRTSLGHVPDPKAAPAERSPQIIAEELLQVSPKEEHDQSPGLCVSERPSRRGRQESSEVSFNTAHSPRRESMDHRSIRPTTTPMSQRSGTAASEAELCEAKGIPFFPHNNKSLLVVQTARQVTIPDYTSIDEDDSDLEGNPIPGIKRTNFTAFVTPADEIGKPLYSVESPLTNPREAPEPPVIKFIPPTPNDELERQLGDADEQSPRSTEPPRAHLQRSLSIKERLRRFSESLNQPVPFGRQNSYRRSAPSRRTPQAEAQRPTHLSSFWQPRDFWADYYSDESDIDDDDDHEPLPPGGDTSDVVDEERNKRNAFSFPRAMSKRMPGFRGTGGFLMGNSLGIDRHGSNSRRHYVERRPNASHPSLRQYSSSAPNLSSRQSEEMLRRLHRRRIFKIPFAGGRRVEYIGFSAFAAKLQAKRKLRQERQADARREKLRESIGPRVYHDGPRITGRNI